MRCDISELEIIELFLTPIKKMRFETEELNKMLESRIENLLKHMKENDSTTNSLKTIKNEAGKCVEGSISLAIKSYATLNENLQKSFHRIEENQEETRG